MTSPELTQVGRLAMRVEGDLWVAYYAMPNTMKDALFLGSIQMAFVQDEPAKQIFMSLMRDAVSAIIKQQTGVKPEWPDPFGRSAPSHERWGPRMTRTAITITQGPTGDYSVSRAHPAPASMPVATPVEALAVASVFLGLSDDEVTEARIVAHDIAANIRKGAQP